MGNSFLRVCIFLLSVENVNWRPRPPRLQAPEHHAAGCCPGSGVSVRPSRGQLPGSRATADALELRVPACSRGKLLECPPLPAVTGQRRKDSTGSNPHCLVRSQKCLVCLVTRPNSSILSSAKDTKVNEAFTKRK